MSQRGAFILNSVGHKQLTTIVQKYSVGTGTNTSSYYIPIANSWESAGAIGTYGWFGGGIDTAGPAPNFSNVDRVDFSNDSPTSASSRGGLSTARYYLGGVANANYSWFAGGLGSSQIDRIDFANDSPTTANVRGPLSLTRYALAATGNANYGWFGSGFAPGVTSSVERIDFSNNSPAGTGSRGPLNSARYALAATSNANYGWFGGGYAPAAPTARVSWVERVDFSNDSPTAASPRGLLSAARQGLSAISNTNYGWFAGGINPGSSVVSTVDRIDFSNDSPTSASARGPLATSVQIRGASGNANYGWFGGGRTSLSGTVVISAVDRIDFSNDSPATASIRGPLSSIRGGLAGTSNYVKALPNFVGVGSVSTGTFGIFGSPNSVNTTTGISQTGGTYGWWGGGQTPTVISTVQRVDFSNDSPTAASNRGSLSSARSNSPGAGTANYGWFGGGFPAVSSIVDRIDFANDSPASSSPRGSLTAARGYAAGVSNANYGWWAGGGSPSVSIIDRIDFKNDSPTAATARGPLTSARYAHAGTSNQNYAWYVGGMTAGPAISNVDRIDFSNDSPGATSARQGLTTAQNQIGATGNAYYGWFGGSNLPAITSIVVRIDYSNDSPTAASPRGGLSTARYGTAASGNENFGWWGGGFPAVTSLVNRLDYSNDTAATTVRGPLSVTVYHLGAVSNYVKDRIDPRSGGLNVNLYATTSTSNTATGVTIYNGTFAWVSGTSSSVERIDLASDLAVASVRGPLSLARMLGSTTHNTQYGWFLGGLQPASPYARYSLVDRIDYANDSPTAATVRGNLSIAKAQHTSMGNINYGWVAGGETVLGTSSLYSSVDRIDYSNESPASSSPRGPLTAARGYMDATATEYYGWVAGGGFTVSPTAYSTVERIDFGNDSPTAAARRSNLQTATYEIAGAGNRNYGWFNRGGASTSLVERLDYSNDTVNTLLRGSLSSARTKHSAASNSSYGWWIGGFVTPNPVSTVDRIDFSNDSPTASASRGPLAATRYGTASASNYVTTLLTGFVVTQYNKASASVGTNPQGTYGWFSGGYIPVASQSTVERIDFSNDSPTGATARGSLSAGQTGSAGTSNANYGWAGGNGPSGSTVNRIDFANDGSTPTIRGPLIQGRQSMGAAGNANYGWFGGGGPSQISSIDRIDYANDSPTSSSRRGNLSIAKDTCSATSNPSYGWWGGGVTPAGTSTVERIDFSNDSPTTASPRGPLTIVARVTPASGNANYGWWYGGASSTSVVSRIDYSNDTATASSRGFINSGGRSNVSGLGNAYYGWVGGNQPVNSTMERIDYSNDLATASVRGLLTQAKFSMATMSNYVK
jgi:hypothetical protein